MKPGPGFVNDFIGSRTRTTSLWKEGRALDEHLQGLPIPRVDWIAKAGPKCARPVRRDVTGRGFRILAGSGAPSRDKPKRVRITSGIYISTSSITALSRMTTCYRELQWPSCWSGTLAGQEGRGPRMRFGHFALWIGLIIRQELWFELICCHPIF